MWNLRTSARTSMYKPNGKSHVRAAFKMSYKHVDVRALSHFCVHTPALCVSWPSRRVGIPSGRAVSLLIPSPNVAIASDRLHSSLPVSERVRRCRDTVGSVHECTRFRRSHKISTVCVRHFSFIWVCRHTTPIKTRDWTRSDANCRFRLFCSNRGQRGNPPPSVTVA